MHTHSNFAGIQENPSISTVGYLSIPSDMKPIEGEKEHNKFSGCVEWREGSEGMFQFATYKREPKERNFYIFPGNLEHQVYPHNSEEPRISFSFNAVIKFENKAS